MTTDPKSAGWTDYVIYYCQYCGRENTDRLRSPAPSAVSGLAQFLESREFYELMYAYRTSPITDQEEVVNAFEDVKAALRSHQAPVGEEILSAKGYGSKLHIGTFLNDRFTFIVNPDVPPNEIHIKDPTGRLLGKIINVGYD